MSSIDHEAKARIGFQILIGLIEAARGGYPIHGAVEVKVTSYFPASQNST